MSAPSPPDEPPLVRARSYGFLVVPKMALKLCKCVAVSSALDLVFFEEKKKRKSWLFSFAFRYGLETRAERATRGA